MPDGTRRSQNRVIIQLDYEQLLFAKPFNRTNKTRTLDYLRKKWTRGSSLVECTAQDVEGCRRSRRQVQSSLELPSPGQSNQNLLKYGSKKALLFNFSCFNVLMLIKVHPFVCDLENFLPSLAWAGAD